MSWLGSYVVVPQWLNSAGVLTERWPHSHVGGFAPSIRLAWASSRGYWIPGGQVPGHMHLSALHLLMASQIYIVDIVGD